MNTIQANMEGWHFYEQSFQHMDLGSILTKWIDGGLIEWSFLHVGCHDHSHGDPSMQEASDRLLGLDATKKLIKADQEDSKAKMMNFYYKCLLISLIS